mmetsp:Transcript_31605/g.101062  ORF Transcript_31605/g.101062 Transcript_31605/m.101062 type:complete len:217 (-) Transcript_31605:1206-1856(-)
MLRKGSRTGWRNCGSAVAAETLRRSRRHWRGSRRTCASSSGKTAHTTSTAMPCAAASADACEIDARVTLCACLCSELLPGSKGLTTCVKEIACARSGGGAVCAQVVNQCGGLGRVLVEDAGDGICASRCVARRRVHSSQQRGGLAEAAASASRCWMKSCRTASDQVPSGSELGARGRFFGLALAERVKARSRCASGTSRNAARSRTYSLAWPSMWV